MPSSASLLRKKSPDECDQVEANLSPAAAEALAGVNALRWVPMADHMEFCMVLRSVVGAGAPYTRFWQDVMESLLERPILSAFSSMMFRLSDAPDRVLMRNAPRIFTQLFRDCGTLSAELSADKSVAVARVEGFPSQFDIDCFREGTAGAIAGVYARLPEGERYEVRSRSAGPGSVEITVVSSDHASG